MNLENMLDTKDHVLYDPVNIRTSKLWWLTLMVHLREFKVAYESWVCLWGCLPE